MPQKRFGAEQIVTLLCQIEVTMGQGKYPNCLPESYAPTQDSPHFR